MNGNGTVAFAVSVVCARASWAPAKSTTANATAAAIWNFRIYHLIGWERFSRPL
jgi:hypothetical protein